MHIVPIASEHTHTHTHAPDIFSSLPNFLPVVKSRYGGQRVVAYSSVCRRNKRICQTTTVSDHLLSLQKQQLQDLLVWCLLLLQHQLPQTLLTECNAAARNLPSLSSYLSRNSLEQEESKEDRRRERRISEDGRRHLANLWRIRYR